MFHHSWPANEDLWSLYHKVTFDGINKLIIVNDGETSINIEIDIYSDWKEWALQRDNLKFLQALRTVGGDPTTGGDSLGATFFTVNNWQILINESTNFVGNIFSDDFATPFRTADGVEIAQAQVSNLIDKVTIDTGDLITAGVATTVNITDQTTTLQTDITTQTTTLQSDIADIPADVIAALNSTNYDNVPFGDIMAIILSMAQGRIVESATGVFNFYSQDNTTILYTLTKSGSQRTRS